MIRKGSRTTGPLVVYTAEGFLYLVRILWSTLGLVVDEEKEVLVRFELNACNAPTEARTRLHSIFTQLYL